VNSGNPAPEGAGNLPGGHGLRAGSWSRAPAGAGKSPAEATWSALFSALPRPGTPADVTTGCPSGVTASVVHESFGGRGTAAEQGRAGASHR